MTDWIKYISVFFVIVPLLLSAITFTTFKFSPALLIFLSVGFTADLLNLHSERLNIERQLVWDLYSMFECSMLLWMVRHRQNHLTFKACLMTLLISVSLWTACQYLYGKSFLFPLIAITPLSVFIIIYQAFLVFYSAKEILWLCENENRIILSPLYWILTGIFFYSIGTFFIMGFLSNPILHNMYYINNIVNILTHLLFLISLSMCLHHSRSIRHI